ncbi:MAG: phosphatidylserine/phosphatidylglycerophosphate/cardiolipin synthase family protein [Gammaproteobacteria bacterium]|nr:phosphatidylserine/phosphatidylglycerophosphate/cardiolipin synthase family protein [Gammaproteobacteria bacterium]
MTAAEKTDRLFFTPDTYFDALLRDIAQAQSSVILETYIFRFDEVGWRFVRQIQEVCAKGVEVRLLVDGVGSFLDTQRLVEELESERCSIRIFHPLPWDFRAYRNALSAGQHYSEMLYHIASINRRDHRKLCIIDQQIAWLGSFNITADHYNRKSDKANQIWHDTGLRTTSRMVAALIANFEQVWQRKGESRTQRTRQFLAVNTIVSRRRHSHEIVELIQTAESRIYITNAYFNPSKRLLKTLKQAAAKQLSVKLIVPSRSDVLFFPSLSRTYYADLLGAGIRVFEYSNRVLHSKTMLIDDAVLIGSTNLNFRSFIHDLEVDALVFDEKAVKQMEQKFESDLTHCIEVTLRRWRKYPKLLKLLGWLPRLLRYWF